MNFFVVKSKHLFIGIFLLVILCIFIGTGKISPVFKDGTREIPIYSVKRDDNKIALTFNCAWNDDDVDSILKALDEYDTKCTFFMVGTWASKYPESVKKIYDAGHEIASHSYAHDHYSGWSTEKITADILKSDDVFKNIINIKPTLFRAGYGEYNNNVINACKENNKTYIQWSLDSLDYKASSGDEIYNRVLSKLSSGSIVLLHQGCENTAKILPNLLCDIKKEYSPCTVSELIYKENYTIDGNGKQIKN